MMDNSSFTDFLQTHCTKFALPETLGKVIQTIVQAGITISQTVRLGDLAGILGAAGSGNIQGEAQQKLDILANTILLDALKLNPHVAGLASEEEDSFVLGHKAGEYLVLFDPLDGSSNIDVNISTGTIFSVLHKTHSGCLKTEDFLQAGKQQVAAGYVLYGTQTQLVITLGHGVYAFTLNADNIFVMTRQDIRIAPQAAEFAINMSNYRHWQAAVRDYIDELLAGKEGVRGKNYNMRWVASMVAEVHRILMRGGIFMYPKDNREPHKAGKLRLLYEANPMSFLIEQAGGASCNIIEPILHIQPEQLHQRVAVILGASEEVNTVWQKHQNQQGS